MQAVLAPFKVIWLAFWLIVFSLILFFPVMVAALAARTGRVAFFLMQSWAWLMLRVFFVRVKIRGRENVKPGQGYVILSNHRSLLDVPALVTSLGVPYRWVIKKELRAIPLFGQALAASRNIFIDRSNGKKAMQTIQKGVAQLPPGTGVLFFPEGRISPDGRMLPFKRGAFVTARNSGLPVLPVTVIGSRQCLRRGSVVFQPGTITVVIHPPIDVNTIQSESLEALMERTKHIISCAEHSTE